MVMFTWEAEESFLQEHNLRAYIEAIEVYLETTEWGALSDAKMENCHRKKEQLQLAKQMYNQYVDFDLISYKEKQKYDV